jgi:hypothetical protein
LLLCNKKPVLNEVLKIYDNENSILLLQKEKRIFIYAPWKNKRLNLQEKVMII